MIRTIEEIRAFYRTAVDKEAAIKKCPPTEADGDKDGYVLSFLVAPLSGSTLWAVAHYKSVINDPKFNRFWLPMPAAPEVIP